MAEVIISDLDRNGIQLENPAYRTLYEEYRTLWETGAPIDMHHFINHPDPAVATATVDLLTSDDNYTASKLWQKHDISVESEQDRLPRVVILYKSKVIEKIIAELERKLRDDQLSEEELATVTHQISALNQERILIAKRLSRLIL